MVISRTTKDSRIISFIDQLLKPGLHKAVQVRCLGLALSVAIRVLAVFVRRDQLIVGLVNEFLGCAHINEMKRGGGR
jgi:hypothetical protein